MQECMISFSPASNVTASLFNQPTSTQVCRSRVRRYNKITADIEAFQHFVSARYSTVVDRSMTVSCMQRAKESQSPSRPLLPLAIFSGKWGFLSEATVPSSIFETQINPKSSQVWLVSLVLFPWWLLMIVLAAALILVVFGGWGDLAEIVAAILYSYAFRPVPPVVAERRQFDWWGPQYPLRTSVALSHVALIERVEFALVRHQEVHDDRLPPLEIRIVRRKWSLSIDDDISLERTGKETILELEQSLPRLMSAALKRLVFGDVQE
ncbi:hypothetical protein BCR44DRAFT_1444940 [Catenaria anguillulae PL171]|uniref:Uncharacterized protein n=1 Tax=Catenaria anguillulae PL171 TaxID=765915 RepID=A0A1Y2H783_9FUNG|nr:hypothetical protein BCR44DRAFT_1444940 [Catenaria anguillulae PL171]